MKKKYLLPIFRISLLTLLLASCVKDPLAPQNSEQYCTQMNQLHVQPFTPVEKGEQISVSVPYMDGVNYYWSGPNNFQSYSQNNVITYDADFSDRGWYYVNMTYDQCENHLDSVYVTVKFPQGTPACSPTNNTANFTSALFLGDQSYYFVSFGPDVAGYGITGNSSNADMDITMSSYWNTHDLEDGIYYTTGSPLPDRIDQIHMSNVNQSIWWNAEPDKPVYISHVGGKQRITFCGIDFSGDWGGTLYHTTVDAQITQP